MILEKERLKDKLFQINDIRKEISELQVKIEKLEKEGVLNDCVEASSKHFPYTKYNVKVEAKNPKLVKKINLYKAILQERLELLLDVQTELEEFISKLPTSRLRRIFELRYIEQYTWTKIAYIISEKNKKNATSDSVRMEHDRFFKEN